MMINISMVIGIYMLLHVFLYFCCMEKWFNCHNFLTEFVTNVTPSLEEPPHTSHTLAHVKFKSIGQILTKLLRISEGLSECEWTLVERLSASPGIIVNEFLAAGIPQLIDKGNPVLDDNHPDERSDSSSECDSKRSCTVTFTCY